MGFFARAHICACVCTNTHHLLVSFPRKLDPSFSIVLKVILLASWVAVQNQCWAVNGCQERALQLVRPWHFPISQHCCPSTLQKSSNFFIPPVAKSQLLFPGEIPHQQIPEILLLWFVISFKLLESSSVHFHPWCRGIKHFYKETHEQAFSVNSVCFNFQRVCLYESTNPCREDRFLFLGKQIAKFSPHFELTISNNGWMWVVGCATERSDEENRNITNLLQMYT